MYRSIMQISQMIHEVLSGLRDHNIKKRSQFLEQDLYFLQC